jgi:DNA-binding CsgD family transcriptional regulator
MDKSWGGGTAKMNARNAFLDIAYQTREATCLETHWHRCQIAFEELGIDGIGYGIIPFRSEVFLQGSSNAMMFRHSYPKGWADDTGPQRLLDDDVTIPLLASGRDDLIWVDTEELLDQADIPAQERKRFVVQNEIDRAYDMNQGVTIALDIDQINGVTSGMGLRNSSMTETEFSAYWSTHQHHLKAISSVLDTGIRKDHLPSYVGLTTTERDCLSLAASGRQFAEIEYLMRLSEDQVKKTFTRCRKKLQAKTRDHAVAKALVLGLINP